MKKMIVVALFAFVAGTVSVSAQGGFQRRTVEERVQAVHQKIDSAFKPGAAKLVQADSAFATYYRNSDKVRDELRAAAGGERPDPQAMRDKTQPYLDARDKELKTILGDDNFKKWKDEIEPAMRPRGGGPRN